MSKEEEEANRTIEMFWDDFCPKDHFPNNNFCECNTLTQSQAIKCAIIHVKGVIQSNPTYEDPECEDDICKQVICNKPFWQEVLTILNNK